jgi:hypothetical protein
LFLLFLFALFGIRGKAQSVAQPDPLFLTIKSLDAKLFDAYNHCDVTTLGAMVSDDLKFYHDQTGLSVGKAPFLAAIKQNICGKGGAATATANTGSVSAEGIWSG